MTTGPLAFISREVREPSLWATTPRGDIIGLYGVEIRYHAANQATWRIGERAPCGIQTHYPETYTLMFSKLRSVDEDAYLATSEARLIINDISFGIDSLLFAGERTEGAATGWPIQIAHTIPTDDTPCFPGWEDVGYEYLDQYEDWSS